MADEKCPKCGFEKKEGDTECSKCGIIYEKYFNKIKYPNIIVTTGDLKEHYKIIGPIYFQVSNKGIFSSTLSKLVKQYATEIAQMKKQGQIGKDRSDWGFLYGEWSVGQNDFERAFFVAVQELKKRAFLVGANAIIGMKQDLDLDTNEFQYFYLQMYGTAVKIIDK